MDIQAIVAAAVPIVAGLFEGIRRLKKASREKKIRNTRDNETHTYVSNHLIHAVERIESKLDHVAVRVDDHIEAHKERGREPAGE